VHGLQFQQSSFPPPLLARVFVQAIFFLDQKSQGKLVQPVTSCSTAQDRVISWRLLFTHWLPKRTREPEPICIPLSHISSPNSVCSFSVFEQCGPRVCVHRLPLAVSRCVFWSSPSHGMLVVTPHCAFTLSMGPVLCLCPGLYGL
jgi:hypothetical protein